MELGKAVIPILQMWKVRRRAPAVPEVRSDARTEMYGGGDSLGSLPCSGHVAPDYCGEHWDGM